MSISIYVPVVNNPEFIRLQVQACKAFCKEQFRFVVFNDAKAFPDTSNWNNAGIKQEIVDVCKELGVECINVPNDEDMFAKSPSYRHSRTANFMWKHYQTKEQHPVLTLDSDMFPIKSFSLFEDLVHYDFAYVEQVRGGMPFAWPNLWWMDPTKLTNHDLIDWGSDVINGDTTDTGGKSWRWFVKNDSTRVQKIKYQPSCTWNKANSTSIDIPQAVLDFCEEDIKNVNNKYWCEIYENRFLHLRAGSNWEGIAKSIHTSRTLKLNKLLSELMACENESS